jgi:hypothetical protein
LRASRYSPLAVAASATVVPRQKKSKDLMLLLLSTAGDQHLWQVNDGIRANPNALLAKP